MKRLSWPCILLGLVAFLFFLYGNSALSITDPVESNYALTAKEMVLAGDWLSPRIYGQFWYDKPILIYFFLCLSYTFFGFTDFASRFPSALFGVLTILLVYWYLKRQQYPQWLAVISGAITATSLEVWIISHGIITDSLLFFFSSATMLFAYIGITEKKRNWVIAAYSMAAFAVLTKGPVGLVLPGLLLLCWVLYHRKDFSLSLLFPPLGILAFFCIAAPWYILMYAKHGTDFLMTFFGLHNYLRATVSEHPQDNVWYYYLALVPVSLLPWTGLSLYGFWKGRNRSPEYTFYLIWALGTILFYSLMATKYPTYTYIANLPLLLGATKGLLLLWERKDRRSWLFLTVPTLFLWLLWLGSSFFVPWGNWTLLYLFVPVAILFYGLAIYRRAFLVLPIFTIIGTVVLSCIVISEALIPFTQYRSFESRRSIAIEYPYDMYSFGNYRTSYAFYTGQVMTAIRYDNPYEEKRSQAWEGKWTMPMIDIEQLELEKDKRKPFIITVSGRDKELLKNYPIYEKLRTIYVFDKETWYVYK